MFWSSFLGTLAAFYVVTWLVLISATYAEYVEHGRNEKAFPATDVLFCTLLGPIILLVFLPDLSKTLAHRVKELLVDTYRA